LHTSLFDLFKIGIGPSSSHTTGPMRAAHRFVSGLSEQGLLPRIQTLRAQLYGSLALTGRGHATDRAILLGLMGQRPETVDPDAAETLVEGVRATRQLPLLGEHPVPFHEESDLLFQMDQVLVGHPNAMRFTALDAEGAAVQSDVYYSIGGGFIQRAGTPAVFSQLAPVPYPFSSGEELLELCDRHGLSICTLMLANESAWRSRAEVLAGIDRIWATMQACIDSGLATEGILPGGLNVRRRAPRLYQRLRGHRAAPDPLAPIDWVNTFAMAVNEENAAGRRVVTAPTNGAAGVIPAIGRYYWQFLQGDTEGIHRYFLGCAAIGVLYKENASISGAEVGCQGEVGVACSMAAAGLVAALGGSNEQMEHAAEIAMEHHLGMTCDPIGGLVQIPCIERNAIGAVKAINAMRLVMQETGGHKVSLDQVIKTMYQTGLDMQSRYKETSQAGLAVNVIEC
jgi:L-serine dehydratase